MIRYIVERISDGKFLELELPITVTSAMKKVSGPGALAGDVAPALPSFRLPSGELLVDQFATFIHEEIDGMIRGTWFVTRAAYDSAWKIEGAGFSGYLSGLPYEGEYRGIRVDMADVIRHIWAHAQRFTRSNIGVTVTGTTGVIRGTDSDLKADATKKTYEARKATLKVAADKRKAKSAQIKKAGAPYDKQVKTLLAQQKPLKDAYQKLIDARKPLIEAHRALTKQRATRTEVYTALVKQKNPAATPAQIAAAKAAVDALKQPILNAAAAVNAKKPGIDAAKVPLDAKNSQLRVVRANKALALEPMQIDYDELKAIEEPLKKPVEDAKAAWEAAKEKQSADGGAWKILWWDTPDCSTEVQNCLTEAGWEFVEWSGWNPTKTKVLKEIRLQKRVGRKRQDLRFIEGENISNVLVLETPGMDYANSIVAIGAGEGKNALRVTVDVADGRRRRVHVLDAKNVTKASVLKALATKELTRRSRVLRVTDARVDTSHLNAPKGSFDVGDSILIESDVKWLGRKSIWHRIEEIEWVSEYIADLKLGVDV